MRQPACVLSLLHACDSPSHFPKLKQYGPSPESQKIPTARSETSHPIQLRDTVDLYSLQIRCSVPT